MRTITRLTSRSASEMLPVGYEVVQSMEQNRVAARDVIAGPGGIAWLRIKALTLKPTYLQITAVDRYDRVELLHQRFVDI